MKKIYAYLLPALLSIAWACSEKDNMDPVGNWDMSNPALTAPTANATVTLDENEPDALTRFEWQPAVTSNNFIVQYTVVLVPTGSTDYDHPIFSVTPANAGKDTWVAPTAAELDYALWAACYPAGAEVKLQWVVVAKAIERKTVDTRDITIKRFETEYVPTTLFLTGEATEAGTDVTKAIPFRALVDADSKQTGVFELYTHLNKGAKFMFRDQADALSRKMGGADGKLTCGTDLTATDSAEYRITVDVVNNTYDLMKIDRWSLVGDAVEGGWGGDVPLTYVGNSVWEKEIEFFQPYDGAGFVFRANGDWGYLLKRVKNTAAPDNKGGKLIMESEGNDTGVEFEDVPGTTGLHKVTLSLTAAGYTYKLTKIQVVVETIIGKSSNMTADAVTGTFPINSTDVPAALYLLEDGTSILTLTKDGNTFSSDKKYIALQASKTYKLNSAADGSGTTYDGDDDGIITVDHDQAYFISVDFDAKTLSWKHYNMKLFHWDEKGGGWDQRQELVMTYTHPYKYDVTGDLTAGFASKFNSPWDVQFGTSSMALSGTMTNGGDNYYGITSTGTYKASIVVSEDYTTADYSFVKQ